MIRSPMIPALVAHHALARPVAAVLVATPTQAPSTTVVRLPALGPIDPGSGQSTVVPGVKFLDSLASGLGTWALIASVIGIFAGGVIWAFGSYSQNYQQAYNGRKGVLVSGLAALLVGAGPYLVGFFYSQGGGIR